MKPPPKNIVAYRRTSTNDQRLGIVAQEATLKRIATERKCEIIKTFTEHESGGDVARVELDKAIRFARRSNAFLVVAKLDRLARDATFLMKLHDGDVPIIFGDLPEVDGSAASRFMVQTMANIAEFERRRIGERTKEALAELKAKGSWIAKKSGKLCTGLGTPANLTDEARLRGSKSAAIKRVAKAIDDQSDIAEIACQIGGTLRQIAAHLNDEGYTTRNGNRWSHSQVRRVLMRLPK